ncbi:hypothetical protein SAMN03159496_05847 [Rhizobium sp. NFR07]|uniref:hypothetical protein n=1 Tax=Rhizobium sp. NFR07 TaxID=1566262 RepID=UPI0008E8BE85|nr:hypothetical protein [Rhizobium sp. NFR07]SFB61570.1 hypothetical protein SAMN03159496_05847 [Rhizobium sp. NFR07]
MTTLVQHFGSRDFRRFSRIVVLVLCIGLTTEGQACSRLAEMKDSAEMIQNIEREHFGKRMLLVELYGTTTYVFDSTHEVAGPVMAVLRSLGYELVLPAGVSIPSEGLLPIPSDAMRTADPDHVFLMNFSNDEAAVERVIADLGAFSENRVYRMNSTVAEAFSDSWNACRLGPIVAEAIERSTTMKEAL